MNQANISPHAMDLWVRSGQAASAAQEIAWIVFIIFVVIGVMIWRSKD